MVIALDWQDMMLHLALMLKRYLASNWFLLTYNPACGYPLFSLPHAKKRKLRTSSASSGSNDESTSISGSESGSDSSCGDAIIDLTLERLQSLHTAGTVAKGDLTEYAKTGMSSRRIKEAVTNPKCTCFCKMPIKVLYQLCVAFWTLTKPSQDSLLWALQHESGNRKKKQWYLAGQLGKNIFKLSLPVLITKNVTPD